MDKKYLTIKNYLRRYNDIKSSVQRVEGDTIIFDFDSDEYSDILSIEMIIKRLYKSGDLTRKDVEIISLFMDGFTFEEIGKYVGFSRQIVSKKLNIAINKIAEEFFREE